MMDKQQMENHKKFANDSLLHYSKYKGKFVPIEKVQKAVNSIVDMMIAQCDMYYKKGFNKGVEQEQLAVAKRRQDKKLLPKSDRKELNSVLKSPVGFRGVSVRSMLRDIDNI